MLLEKICILGIVLICFSCNNDERGSISQNTITDNAAIADSMAAPMLEEAFIDSINIGRKKLNKLEVFKYRADSVYVIIRFYAKYADNWLLKNEYQFEKDGLSECDTKIEDFNNDGLNDMTYISAIAPRGANEIRSLFIYDGILNQLIFIKNSDEYPNLQYNELLDCVDAWVFHSGTSTYFLKIEKDSLRRFAEVVALDSKLTIYTYDKSGVQKLAMNKPILEEDVFVRYKNYKPLVENSSPSY